MYLDWVNDEDKEKCSRCWLKEEYCFCEKMPDPKLRHKLVCYMAVNEIKKHMSSNTGKIIPLWGGQLICEGAYDDERRLKSILSSSQNPVILFPADNAVPITNFKNKGELTIIALDGSWKEAKRMNGKLDHNIPRVCLSDIQACFTLRDSIGATRKYEKSERVQTAPAVVQLLSELGENVTGLKAGV